MKLIFLIIATAVSAQSTDKKMNKKDVGSPPNAVSRGQSESSGISESPSGVTPDEKEVQRTRNESMGGAPNVGAGMGTGTGAGSTIGNEIEEEND